MKHSHHLLLSEDDFKRGLANQVIEQNRPIRVTAKEEDYYPKSPLEEATEHAKIYWMMGWTWEEVEALLQDMEFPENTIEGALKAAKKYAVQIMEKGPFKAMKRGQLVRLKTGSVGRLVAVSEKEVTLELGDDLIKVEEKDIDAPVTQKLLEAYTLRQAADQLLRDAQEKYMIPQRPQKYQEKDILPKGEEPLRVTVKPSPGAPPGWGKETPHVTEVIEVSASIGEMLDNLNAAEELLGEVEAELKPVNQKANEIRSRKKDLLKEQSEIANNIFAIVGSENKELTEMKGTVFRKYKNKLIGLRRTVEEVVEPIGPVEELDALKAILEQNHPRIFNKVMQALKEYKEVNTTINERISKAFAFYPPAQEKMGRRAQLWRRIGAWAKKAWTKILNLAEDLWNIVFPSVDESVDAINEFYDGLKLKTAKYKAERIAAIAQARKPKQRI